MLEQNVISKMKYWFLLLLLLITVDLSAQLKYFIIPDQTDDYTLNHYKLSTSGLYGVNETIELFNVTFNIHPGDTSKAGSKKEENLALFSVLPDLKGKETWKEVSLDTLQTSILSFGKIRQLFDKSSMSNFVEKYGDTTKYLNDYKLIVRKGDKFYVPKVCLLQFYAIRNRPEIFANPFGTINIELDPISILEFEKRFKKSYPKQLFPLYEMAESRYGKGAFDRIRDRREYLSKTIKLKDSSLAYQFWTFTDWHVHFHDFEIDRGIDRFVYLPGKGIIGGSFDFYFYFNRKKLPIENADFMQNIKEEKVMIADNYK